MYLYYIPSVHKHVYVNLYIFYKAGRSRIQTCISLYIGTCTVYACIYAC